MLIKKQEAEGSAISCTQRVGGAFVHGQLRHSSESTVDKVSIGCSLCHLLPEQLLPRDDMTEPATLTSPERDRVKVLDQLFMAQLGYSAFPDHDSDGQGQVQTRRKRREHEGDEEEGLQSGR